MYTTTDATHCQREKQRIFEFNEPSMAHPALIAFLSTMWISSGYGKAVFHPVLDSEPQSYLPVSAEYKCKGEVKFHLKINQPQHQSPTNLHMRVCQSSWYNRWCSKDNSKFLEKKCHVDKEHYYKTNGTNGTLVLCVLDKPMMCEVNQVERRGNWFHQKYITEIVGTIDHREVKSNKLFFSPSRSEMGCQGDGFFTMLKKRRNDACESFSNDSFGNH